MQALNSIAQFFQSTIGSISIASIDHRWLIIAFAALIVVLIVFTQEKHKAITYLIVIYAFAVAASYVPQIMTKYEKAVPQREQLIIGGIVAALPVVALIVLKKKRGKSRTPSG